MSKDKKHIDQLIQDKLLQSEVRPPENSWNAIEASLDASKAKPLLYYVRYVAAAAIVGLLITIGVFQLKNPEELPVVFTVIEQDAIDAEETKAAQDSVIQNQNIDTKIVIPQKSGVEFIKNVASIPKLQQIKAEDELKLPIETTVHSIHGIYSISTIAHNNFIMELPTKLIQKTAEELYQDYLAINEQMFANENDSKVQKNKLQSLDIGYGSAMALAFGNRSDNPTDSYHSLSNSNKEEESLNLFSFGINLNYKISKRFNIQTGIGYFKQGISIKDLRVFAIAGETASTLNDGQLSSGIAANTSHGNIVINQNEYLLDNSSNLGNAEFYQLSGVVYGFNLSQYFEYIEIPIIAAYSLIDHKFKVTLLAGLNTGILVGNKVFLNNTENLQVGTTEEMNTFLYKGILGFSVDYPIFKKFHLFISPSLRYQLNKSNKMVTEIPNRSYIDFKTGLSFWF